MLAASFTTIESQVLRGTVMYDVDTDNVYCIGLFYDDEEFGFSLNLQSLIPRELNRLKIHAKNKSLVIFPVKYECDSSCVIGGKFIGIFAIS